ncbi:MAG: hypothetical protein ACI84R_000870 [Candidatus Azotimanducaceae bacterium]|jgi:hypothetical protein
MKRYSASIASIAKGFTDVSYPKMDIKLKGAVGYTLLSDFAHCGSGHDIKKSYTFEPEFHKSEDGFTYHRPEPFSIADATKPFLLKTGEKRTKYSMHDSRF